MELKFTTVEKNNGKMDLQWSGKWSWWSLEEWGGICEAAGGDVKQGPLSYCMTGHAAQYTFL